MPRDPTRSFWAYPHNTDRNYIASLFHMASAFLMLCSLFRMNWFLIWDDHERCTSELALFQFITLGYFESPMAGTGRLTISNDLVTSPLIIEYHTGNEVLKCVTPEILNLMRVIIMLCILCIFYSIIGFLLDIFAPTKKSLRFIRRNALPSIWSVLTIISIIGVCYLVTRSLKLSIRTIFPHYAVSVTYDYGCYLITGAGALSLLATACNLMQEPPPMHEIVSVRQRLVDEEFEGESFAVGMRRLPPPPPYTP